MSMARLWRAQGKPQQARELLAPVYGWFKEAFDTLDLKQAKALLDTLAAWSIGCWLLKSGNSHGKSVHWSLSRGGDAQGR
jgi:hypothetical protein